jgi:hypothetical protein
MSHDNFITVRQYHDAILADLICTALNDAGIDVMSSGEASVLPTDTHTIKVREEDVDAALEIIEAHENI